MNLTFVPSSIFWPAAAHLDSAHSQQCHLRASIPGKTLSQPSLWSSVWQPACSQGRRALRQPHLHSWLVSTFQILFLYCHWGWLKPSIFLYTLCVPVSLSVALNYLKVYVMYFKCSKSLCPFTFAQPHVMEIMETNVKHNFIQQKCDVRGKKSIKLMKLGIFKASSKYRRIMIWYRDQQILAKWKALAKQNLKKKKRNTNPVWRRGHI